MRRFILLALAAVCLASLPSSRLPGSTLQRLSLNDMIEKSTMIVRGTVQPGPAAFRGAMIYTHYQVQVSKAFKGTPAPSIDVAVPGGAVNGIQQAFAGSPMLTAGQEYVLFLWTSKSGLTQVIGLSQGLFNVITNPQGQLIVSRGAASERMVDSTGQTVSDSSIQMPLAQLRTKIQTVLAGGNSQ
jgi:hypothetical protein